MAKVVIAGEAVVITSTLKLEDYRTIAKFRPDELTLRGGEDGKEPIFAVGVTNGSGEINKFGASFGRESHDEAKLATITMAIGCATDDVRDVVADKLGTAIINLNRLEEKLPGVLAEIAAEKEAVLSNITIAQ